MMRLTDFSKCSKSQRFASICIIVTCTDVQVTVIIESMHLCRNNEVKICENV